MDNLIEQLRHYVSDILGLDLAPRVWPGNPDLPFYLRDTYAFYVGDLTAACLLMVDRSGEDQPPSTVHKHVGQLRRFWEGPVVYVCPRLNAYARKRLIEQKVSFMVPGNQLYLPELGFDLREYFKTRHVALVTFSPATQVLLLHCLWRETPAVLTPGATAKRLGYSAMTMGRAFDEIEVAGLGASRPCGRERRLELACRGRELWDRARPLLRSPVRQRGAIIAAAAAPPGPAAGLTALARYSRLAEPTLPVVAVSRREWRRLARSASVKVVPYREPPATEIEVWSYDPKLFAESEVVDRLSLWLALHEHDDERIQTALAELLEAMPW